MHDSAQLKVPKWPFFLADAFMLGLAYFIYLQGKGPLIQWEITAIGICVALGTLLGIIPFVLDYRGVLKIIETNAVGSAVEKIQNLENIAKQISTVANLWENAHQQADKTTAVVSEISDRMNAELKDFKVFIQKASDSERATLRLEVDKLRRAETEWLQILVRILDHVFALYSAAQRSGQQQVISQLGQFQNACRESARRIGLLPFVAAHSESFDSQRHKWADGEKPDSDAVIGETLATGYTFQGKLIRPALVRLKQTDEAAKEEIEKDELPEASQNQLPLEPAET